MTLPMEAGSSLEAADRASSAPGGIDPRRLLAANINPKTLLATDFLNHFNEATMMLEMLPEIPDCIEDLNQWRPMTYPEHFSASNFKDRELAILAYDLADPAVRQRLDDLADEMNAILASTIEAMMASSAAHAMALAEAASHRLKPLVAQAGAVINGSGQTVVADAEADATQAAVDAFFEH